MTSIRFETSTLSDAIRKAAKVAPTSRGMAFDHAAGLHFEIDPESPHPLVLRATNLDMFHTEWVSAVEVTGPPTQWRLPSAVLERIITSLPIGSGKTVTFTEHAEQNRKIEITSGRNLRVHLNGINRHLDYPVWETFDPDLLTEAPTLGTQIKSVEWAAASGGSAMLYSGIHLDGEVVVATDSARAAIMPCEINTLSEPITIPSQTLSSILKEGSAPKIAVIGTMLCVMPDSWTQIKVRTYGEKYPGTRIRKALDRTFDEEINVNRDELLEVVNRVAAIDSTNRLPRTDVWFGKEEIALTMSSDEVGLLRDIVECPGQALHKRIKYIFNTKNLTDLLSSAPQKEVTLHYNTELSSMIGLSCGGNYQAWISRMAPPTEGKGS